jgi:antitoxin (DNA-binding transcriptional repressor) of toxin-antitoxin stability system
MNNIIGLKELRINLNKYAKEASKGKSFFVFRHTKPLFKISPVKEEKWEEVIDFTKIKKGGVDIDDVLKRL